MIRVGLKSSNAHYGALSFLSALKIEGAQLENVMNSLLPIYLLFNMAPTWVLTVNMLEPTTFCSVDWLYQVTLKLSFRLSKNKNENSYVFEETFFMSSRNAAPRYGLYVTSMVVSRLWLYHSVSLHGEISSQWHWNFGSSIQLAKRLSSEFLLYHVIIVEVCHLERNVRQVLDARCVQNIPQIISNLDIVAASNLLL